VSAGASQSPQAGGPGDLGRDPLWLRVVAGVVVTVLGVAALLVGQELAKCEPYWSSVLSNAGVALFLVLPLLLVERLLARRVRASEVRSKQRSEGIRTEVAAVRSEVEETRSQLGTLRDQTDARFAAARQHDEQAVRRAREEVTYENVSALLERAEELHALSRHGLRVALPHSWERLKFNKLSTVAQGDPKPTPFIQIHLVSFVGDSENVLVAWTEGQELAGTWAELAAAWQRRGGYPGDAILDADAVFAWLLRSLELAVERRTDARGRPGIGPLIEMVNEAWALTDDGLEHLGEPEYCIDRKRIVQEPRITREAMLEKLWVEERADDFGDAYQLAERYFTERAKRQDDLRPPYPM
jgi:hypothetical protein